MLHWTILIFNDISTAANLQWQKVSTSTEKRSAGLHFLVFMKLDGKDTTDLKSKIAKHSCGWEFHTIKTSIVMFLWVRTNASLESVTPLKIYHYECKIFRTVEEYCVCKFYIHVILITSKLISLSNLLEGYHAVIRYWTARLLSPQYHSVRWCHTYTITCSIRVGSLKMW